MNTMAIDQYGQSYHDLGKHPRKTLLKRLYRTGAEKMYIDDLEGNTKHIGYIIGGLWLTLYTVSDWVK